ncbi:uncharacterized protein LOC124170881 isoform X2 [Ischnura elegans]|nr:uncharacterized protein LOC124170881 isoform X2 [Ischnura elegans]XP_046405862.1 uncharacterized protein LOC124170881 isoform X2 [Ischnura elegans]XP_046405863.1 uncharacterized protein LOC124170881 isoform X2 [Ischnura elegans]
MSLRYRASSHPEEEEDVSEMDSCVRSDGEQERRDPLVKDGQLKAASSSEERRRRILARGEERLRRIRGRSIGSSEEAVEEKPILPEEAAFVPDVSRESMIVESGNLLEGEYIRNEPLDIYDNVVPYSLIIFIYAVGMQLSCSLMLFKFPETKDLSYLTPFFIIEACYILHHFLVSCKVNDHRLSPWIILRRKSWKQITLDVFLFIVRVVLFHFCVYFLAVCLMEMVLLH